MQADTRKAVAASLLAFLLLAPAFVPTGQATDGSSGRDNPEPPAAPSPEPVAEAATVEALLAPFRALPREAAVRDVLLAALGANRDASLPALPADLHYTPPATGEDPLAGALSAYGRVLGLTSAEGFPVGLERAKVLPRGLQENVALLVYAMADAESFVKGGAVRPELAELRDRYGLSGQEAASLIVASAIDQAKPGLIAWSALLREMGPAEGTPSAYDRAVALSEAADADPLAAAVMASGSPLGLEELRLIVLSANPDPVKELNILYNFLGLTMSAPLADALAQHFATMDPRVVEAMARILWAENRVSLLREQVFVTASSRARTPTDAAAIEALLASPNPQAGAYSASLGTPLFTKDEAETLGFAASLLVAATDVGRALLAPLAAPGTKSNHFETCRPITAANVTYKFCGDDDVQFRDPLNLVIITGDKSTTFDERFAIPGLVEQLVVSADRRELQNATANATDEGSEATSDFTGLGRNYCVPGSTTCARPTLLSLFNNSAFDLTEDGVPLGPERVRPRFTAGNNSQLVNVTGRSYQVLTLDLGGDDTYRNNAGGADPLHFSERAINASIAKELGFVFVLCNVLPGDEDRCPFVPIGFQEDGRHCGNPSSPDPEEQDPCTVVQPEAENDAFLAYVSQQGVRVQPGIVPEPLPITAVALDLGGADTYISKTNWTQGAATLGGVGILVDTDTGTPKGDTFVAHSNSTAAATDVAFALLANLGDARDTYTGDYLVQAVVGTYVPPVTFTNTGISRAHVPGRECTELGTGASEVNIGVSIAVALLLDQGGKDAYTARCAAQAAQGQNGYALLLDLGNAEDTYRAEYNAQAVTLGGGLLADGAHLIDQGGSDTYNLSKGYVESFMGGLIARGQGVDSGGSSAILLDLAGGVKELRPREKAHYTYYGNDARIRTWAGASTPSGAYVIDRALNGPVPPSENEGEILFELSDLRYQSYHEKPDWALLAIGAGSTNEYRLNYTLLLDLGGADEYHNNGGAIWSNPNEREDPDPMVSAAGSRTYSGPTRVFGLGEEVALLLDIDVPTDNRFSSATAVDDFYNATRVYGKPTMLTYSQGAAGAGCVAFLVDVAGNDRYAAHNFSQGSAVRGVGVLVDLDGNDRYSARTHAQGATNFTLDSGFISANEALGLLFDAAGSDNYTAAGLSQAFADEGRALLVDLEGDDGYYLSGEHTLDGMSALDRKDPLLVGAGQGVAKRLNVEGSGGLADTGVPVAILYDRLGKDRYVAASPYSHGLVLGGRYEPVRTESQSVQAGDQRTGLGLFADDGDGDDTYFPLRTSILAKWSMAKRNDDYWSPNPIYGRTSTRYKNERNAFETSFLSLGLDNVERASRRLAVDVAFAAGSRDSDTPVPSSLPAESPARTAANATAPQVELVFSYTDGATPSEPFQGVVRIRADVSYGEAVRTIPDGSFVQFFAGRDGANDRVLLAEVPIENGAAVLDWDTTRTRSVPGSVVKKVVTPDGPVEVHAYAYVAQVSDAASGRSGDAEAKSYYVGFAEGGFAVDNGPVVIFADVPAFNPDGVRSASRMRFHFSEGVAKPIIVTVRSPTGALRTLTGGPAAGLGYGEVTWDGLIGGVKMGEGTYPLSVLAEDAGGRQTTNGTLSVRIDKVAPPVPKVHGAKPYLNLTNTPKLDPAGLVRTHNVTFTAPAVAGGADLHRVNLTVDETLPNGTVRRTSESLGAIYVPALRRMAFVYLFTATNGSKYDFATQAIDAAGNPSSYQNFTIVADFKAPATKAYLDSTRQGVVVVPVRFMEEQGTTDVASWSFEYQREGSLNWTTIPVPGKSSMWNVVNSTGTDGQDATIRATRSFPFNTAALNPPLKDNETISFRTVARDFAGNVETANVEDVTANVDPRSAAVMNHTVVPRLTSFEIKFDTDRPITTLNLTIEIPSKTEGGAPTVRYLNESRAGKSQTILVEGLAPDGVYPYSFKVATYQGIVTSVTGVGKTIPSLGVVLVSPDPKAEENIITGTTTIKWRSGAVSYRDGGDPYVYWNVTLRIDDGPWVVIGESGPDYYVESKSVAVGSLHELAGVSIRGYNDTRNAFVKVTVWNKFQTNSSIARVVFDKSPPEVTLRAEGTLNFSGWYTSPVSVTLTGEDEASSIKTLRYTVNGVSHTYGAPFLLEDGVHNLTYQAVNSAGLASKLKTIQIKVDTVAPRATFRVDGRDTTGSEDVRFIVTGADFGSGLDAARLYEDDLRNFGPWIPFRKATELRLKWDLQGRAGERTMVAEVRDKAGNIARGTLDLVYDKAAPRIEDDVVVEDVGFTTVKLRWVTTEPSLTLVRYLPSAYEAEEDRSGYELVFEKEGYGTEHVAELRDLLPNVPYRFDVVTEDFLGNTERPAAGMGRFTTLSDEVAPAAVGGLELQVLPSGKVVLTWDAGSDNVGVSHYVVERAPTGEAPFESLGTTRSTTYRDETALPGKSYLYRVVAVDMQGNRGLLTEGSPVTVTTAPVLDGAAVTPKVGDAQTTEFKFTICYLDADEGPQASVTLVLHGKEYPMAEATENACTNGFRTFEFKTTLAETGLADGLHHWHVEASDGSLGSRFPLEGEIPGPVVQNAAFATPSDGVPAGVFGGWRGVATGGVFVVVLAVAIAVALRRRNA